MSEAVRRFVRGEGKLGLICGAADPVDWKILDDASRTFDPIPLDFLARNIGERRRTPNPFSRAIGGGFLSAYFGQT